MANQKAEKLVELGLDEYVAARVQQTDLHVAPREFWVAASEQRALLQGAESLAIFTLSLGMVLIFLAIPTWFFGLQGSSALIVSGTCMALAGFLLCKAGFSRDKWQRVLTFRGLLSLEFRLAREFQSVFDLVRSGEHQLLEISESGIGAFNSPVSHQPVAKAYGPTAFENPKFPETLFLDDANIAKKFIVVAPSPSGDWFNFYVWNEPVASQIADLFDQTPDIYEGDKVKRRKAKIALCTIANFVIQQKKHGRKFSSKDVVVRQFQEALKHQAAVLRQSGEIDVLGELQLCRLNITGTGGNDQSAANLTSGGSESIYCGLHAARNWARKTKPHIIAPEFIVPWSIHAAFSKGAEILGIKLIRVRLGKDHRADLEAMKAAITENCIGLAGSAPCWPYGLYDDIKGLAALALQHDLWMHVDACLGGFAAPFVAKTGRPVPAFDLSVPGVRSLSADLH